jgi:ArsR family transcriptional regulator
MNALKPASHLFKALARKTRMRILNLLLTHDRLCVGDIQDALGLSQPNASRHMAWLKRYNLVEDKRESHWVFYRLSRGLSPLQKDVLDALKKFFASDETMKSDLRRITSLCKKRMLMLRRSATPGKAVGKK